MRQAWRRASEIGAREKKTQLLKTTAAAGSPSANAGRSLKTFWPTWGRRGSRDLKLIGRITTATTSLEIAGGQHRLSKTETRKGEPMGSNFKIQPASVSGVRMLAGMYGKSGSGKTFSALKLMRGLVGPKG